jgi:hypothetical protein
MYTFSKGDIQPTSGNQVHLDDKYKHQVYLSFEKDYEERLFPGEKAPSESLFMNVRQHFDIDDDVSSMHPTIIIIVNK